MRKSYAWFVALLLVSHSVTVFAQNDFRGSCTEFNDYRQTTGVTDVEGATHPGYSGWTHAKVTFSFTYQYSIERPKGKLYCACNKKAYEDIRTCQRECKVTLGCFAGICQPTDSDSGQICIDATLDPTPRQFSVIATPSRLNWKPTSKPTKSCTSEINSWISRVNAHEASHVKDVRSVVANKNNAWARTKHTYKGCGDTEAAAKAKAEQAIQDALSSEAQAINELIQSNASNFHSTAAGAPIGDIDCSICK